MVLSLSCDESWEQACLEGLSAEGIVRDANCVRCRHVTLLPRRALQGGVRERCLELHAELAALPLPPVDFLQEAATVTRSFGSSVFFALRGQQRWRRFVELVANMVGAEPPPPGCLFHMSVWNSQAGDPFRSVGDVRIQDFPHEFE